MDAISLGTIPETGVALHIDQTEEGSPPANMNGSSSKKAKRRKKKKKPEALCEEEEKTLDVAKKPTNEDQNPLSNIRIQEDSCQQAQDSCEKPEDPQSGAIDMTSSERKKKRRKKKKDNDINALRESGIDTNSEVTTKCDARHSSEAQGSKLKNTEEKSVDGTVVNGCLKSKDDTVGQQESADAKADETVSETQNPKAKKKKRRKNKTKEVCDALEITVSKSKDDTVDQQEDADPEAEDTVSKSHNPEAKKKKRRKNKTTEVCEALGNTLATSMERGPVEFMEETAGVCEVKTKKRKRKKKETSPTDQETADMEVCGPSEEICGVQDPGTCEEKTTDENGEIKQKKRRKKKKTSPTDQETADMDVCDPLEEICGVQDPGTCEKKTNDENGEPKQKKRRKKKKTSPTDQETADMEVCDPSEAICGVQDPGTFEEKTNDENGEPKHKKGRKKKKTSPTDQETADMDVCDPLEEISGVQDPGTCEEKTNDENGEPKQKKRRRKKKTKSCEDHETDNTDAKKDDVSVPRSEGELEFDGAQLDTHLSSSVLINDNLTQGLASQETGDLPRCSCKGQITRKLVVFDLNGILADVVRGSTGECVPDGKISLRSVFKRPFVATFLDFCFEKFDVGLWSSRRIGLDYMTDIVMGNHAKNLLFSFDQSLCITTKFKTLENTTKPIFLKDLASVWNRFGTCLSCGKRKYDETNTLLVDDSPDKALCNPPHTGIFPFPYQYTDREDSALGPDGELRKYMERLVDAENVQKFVEENPIGQSAITETHESWSFYSRVIKAHKK
ncbi:hypothetical protein Bca101_053126 [Brassica carinata]